MKSGWKKYLIAIICLGIVFLRYFVPQFVFDKISLYLVVIACLVLYIPNPETFVLTIISKLKRVKFKDAEFEITEEKMDAAIEKVAATQPAILGAKAFSPTPVRGDEKTIFLQKASEVERRIKEFVSKKNIQLNRNRYSPVAISRELYKREIIPYEIFSLISDIWSLRNKLDRGEDDLPELEFMYKYIEVADLVNQALFNMTDGN